MVWNEAWRAPEVWLSDVRLGSFAPGPVDGEPPVLRRRFPAGDVGHLRSFRYTIRHATQLAWLHAVSRKDEPRTPRRWPIRTGRRPAWATCSRT